MNKIEKYIKNLMALFKKNTDGVGATVVNAIEQSIARKTDYSINQKSIFDVAAVGDLIYALMPDKQERERLELSHQRRPYLVVDKEEDKLLAYPLSSSKFYDCSGLETYKLTKYDNDELKNDSYINLKDRVELPINNILSYIGKIETNDLKEIQRRIYFINKVVVGPTASAYKPTIGDIVSYNNAIWLICDTGEKNYECILIKKRTENKRADVIAIRSNNTEYLAYYKKSEFCPKNKDYYVIDIVDKAQVDKVARRLLPLRNNKAFVNMKHCLFEYNNHQYYCYKIINDYLLCYEVYSSKSKKNYKSIIINKKQFYLDTTNTKRLKKSSNYKVIVRSTNNYEFY